VAGSGHSVFFMQLAAHGVVGQAAEGGWLRKDKGRSPDLGDSWKGDHSLFDIPLSRGARNAADEYGPAITAP